MRKIRWWYRSMIGVSILGMLVYLYVKISSLGFFAHINNYQPFHCDYFHHIPGPEDMVLDERLSILYIAGLDRRNLGNSSEGTLYFLDLADSSHVPERMALPISFPFHPHGISAYTSPSNMFYLFVINHRTEVEHTIEIFRRDSITTFAHIRTIEDALISSPNDLTATSDSTFYVTNDSKVRSTLMRSLDVFFQLNMGTVLYFDGQCVHEVISGLGFPNGIALSTSKDSLYVSETIGGKLGIYRIMNTPEKVTELSRYQIGVGLDNIYVHSPHRLYIPSQPNLMALARHRKEGSPSPSVIFMVDVGTTPIAIDTIYSDDGASLSAASSVAIWRNKFYIGVGYDSVFCKCNFPDNSTPPQ